MTSGFTAVFTQHTPAVAAITKPLIEVDPDDCLQLPLAFLITMFNTHPTLPSFHVAHSLASDNLCCSGSVGNMALPSCSVDHRVGEASPTTPINPTWP